MNLKCKTKIENFLTKNNLVDNYNILELLEEPNLENIINKLETFPQDELTDFALECVCEEHLITASYKIERTGMKLGLHRMEHVLALFNNPEHDLKVIHVAGTNGKGSTCSYIKDILKTKYRVGL